MALGRGIGDLRHGRGMAHGLGGLSHSFAFRMTGWQDYAVWAVCLAAVAEALRRTARLLRGRSRGCSSCGSANCPHKRTKE